MNRDRALRLWVMNNVIPGSRWRWTPHRGRPVVTVVWGYRSSGPNNSGQYDVEFSQLLLPEFDGQEIAWLPDGKAQLPKWFLRKLRPLSSHVPWHIWSADFKRLVDEGLIVACGTEPL